MLTTTKFYKKRNQKQKFKQTQLRKQRNENWEEEKKKVAFQWLPTRSRSHNRASLELNRRRVLYHQLWPNMADRGVKSELLHILLCKDSENPLMGFSSYFNFFLFRDPLKFPYFCASQKCLLLELLVFVLFFKINKNNKIMNRSSTGVVIVNEQWIYWFWKEVR